MRTQQIQPKLWIPVYHDTADKRVHRFANRNFTTHEMATGTLRAIPKQWEIEQQFKQTSLPGNGRIRGWLKVSFWSLVIIFLLAAVMWAVPGAY